jgi:hypothetical protein
MGSAHLDAVSGVGSFETDWDVKCGDQCVLMYEISV